MCVCACVRACVCVSWSCSFGDYLNITNSVRWAFAIIIITYSFSPSPAVWAIFICIHIAWLLQLSARCYLRAHESPSTLHPLSSFPSGLTDEERTFRGRLSDASLSKHGPQKPQGLLGTGRRVGRGYGGGGRGRLYTYRYTVTTRMTPALRWAAMRAILMFHNCEGQSHKTVSTYHNF